MFVRTATGWAFNTQPTSSPVFHAVWTSNQDVVPPPGRRLDAVHARRDPQRATEPRRPGQTAPGPDLRPRSRRSTPAPATRTSTPPGSRTGSSSPRRRTPSRSAPPSRGTSWSRPSTPPASDRTFAFPFADRLHRTSTPPSAARARRARAGTTVTIPAHSSRVADRLHEARRRPRTRPRWSVNVTEVARLAGRLGDAQPARAHLRPRPAGRDERPIAAGEVLTVQDRRRPPLEREPVEREPLQRATSRTRTSPTPTCRTRTCRTRTCPTRRPRRPTSPTRTSRTRTSPTRTCRTRTSRTRTCRTRTSPTRTCPTPTSPTPRSPTSTTR